MSFFCNLIKWVGTSLVVQDEAAGAEVSLTMMTSSNGNIFRVTGTLCGEFTGDRRIPHMKASDAELWYFLSSVPE